MIAIVTDSTACLSRKECSILGVRVIPIPYTCCGKSYQESYVDQNGDYAALLGTGEAATSLPSPASFAATFEELLKRGFDVLCLTISSRLSGSYSSAATAARQVGRGRVRVVDSQTTAAGLWFLIRRARELANQNFTLDQTAMMLENMRSSMGVAFSVERMDSLRRSGRMGIVPQSASTILNQRPILGLRSGAVVSLGKARGRTEQIAAMIDCVPATAKEIAVIAFAGGEERARRVMEELARRFPDVPPVYREGGPVLGIHLGLGTMGLAWICA